jgi:hypothetical protein
MPLLTGAATAGTCVCALFVAAGFTVLGDFVAPLFVGALGAAATELAVLGATTGSTAASGKASIEFSVDVNVGGVIAKTAPNPPTVPVAISIARFICKPSRALL